MSFATGRGFSVSGEGQCLNLQNEDEQVSIIIRSAFTFTFPWIQTVCGATPRAACCLTTSSVYSRIQTKQTSVAQITQIFLSDMPRPS